MFLVISSAHLPLPFLWEAHPHITSLEWFCYHLTAFLAMALCSRGGHVAQGDDYSCFFGGLRIGLKHNQSAVDWCLNM